jgi:tRNA pseudouridine55 synthase
MNGWVFLDKPTGITSTKATAMVRHIFGKVKAGHAGTLDPLATGMLPIALGEATKTMPWFNTATKRYLVTILWGTSTDTLDRDGTVTARGGRIPTQEELEHILPQFMGAQMQHPPAYSAILVQGQRSYTLARQGVAVPLPARKIHIFNLCLHFDHHHGTVLDVSCSAGTYMRVLVEDIATALGTLAYVHELRRLQVGAICANALILFDDLKEQQALLVHPPQVVLDDILAIEVDLSAVAALQKGQSIVVDSSLDNQPAYTMYRNQLIGIGHILDGIFYPKRILNY